MCVLLYILYGWKGSWILCLMVSWRALIFQCEVVDLLDFQVADQTPVWEKSNFDYSFVQTPPFCLRVEFSMFSGCMCCCGHEFSALRGNTRWVSDYSIPHVFGVIL